MCTPADMTLTSPLPLSDENLTTHLERESSPGVLSSSLPYPDPSYLYILPGQKKKSHTRKQPAGHVPRPRNAFILFRCDFVRQKKVPDHVEANHRNISRIVGSVWKNMSASQKAPWIAMADMEKKNHARAHPGYKYHPGSESRSRDSRIKKVLHSPMESFSGKDISPVVSPEWTPSPSFTPPIAPLRRSSSCPPPGAFPVLPNIPFGTKQTDMLGFSVPSMTRDDLARRPSRTIMYQSSMPLYLGPTGPSSTATGHAPLLAQWWAADPGSGSPLTTGPYTIAPPGDAPGWDAAPTKPDSWYPWTKGNIDPRAMEHMNPYPTNDLNTNFTNTASRWDNDKVPTFTNPFGAVPGTTSTSDDHHSLAWNLNPSSMSALGNITMQGQTSAEAYADLLPLNAFDPTNQFQPASSASNPHSVDDLDNLFKTRMSLFEAEPGFPRPELASTEQPQIYWGGQDQPTSDADRELASVLYPNNENDLYCDPSDEGLKLGDNIGRGELKRFTSSDHPADHSSIKASYYQTAVGVYKGRIRKDRRKSKVIPSVVSYNFPFPSSSNDAGPSTPSLSNIKLPPLPHVRRPVLSTEDFMRLSESAGLRGDEPVSPEKYQQFRASITEHYLKKFSELKRESRGEEEIVRPEEVADLEI